MLRGWLASRVLDLADLSLADLNAVVDHLNTDSRMGSATGPSGFRH